MERAAGLESKTRPTKQHVGRVLLLGPGDLSLGHAGTAFDIGCRGKYHWTVPHDPSVPSPVGLLERKEKARAEMRRAILDAARHLFIEGGYANVPIRRVATHIDYSPAALYRYFKTKDEIFDALAEEGFRLLMNRETQPDCPPDAPPLERLRHFFWGVYDFSKLYPEYFYLIFLDRSAPRLSVGSEGLRVVEQMYVHVAKIVNECIAAGELDPGLNAYDVFNVLVSCVHGVAALHVCDRTPVGCDPDALAQAVLDLSIAGLKSGAMTGVMTGKCPPSESSEAHRPTAKKRNRVSS